MGVVVRVGDPAGRPAVRTSPPNAAAAATTKSSIATLVFCVTHILLASKVDFSFQTFLVRAKKGGDRVLLTGIFFLMIYLRIKKN